ncbi:MAG: conjugal transfer protein TraD [Clostridiales bacterium]|nr:conjugal transfer protein TraD [Clostridiales bacterium]
MAQRTYDERIAELQKKRDQLKEQEKALIKRQNAEERKKRTRRLIELGGIVESVLGRPTVDEDKIRFLNFLKKQENNGKFFTKAMNEKEPKNENNAEG